MIIGSKTTGYPVPGIEIEGRKLFLEVLPVDNESKVQEACMFVERALKEWANMKPGVNFTRKVNCNPLRATILEG